jgi:hypothetical protein
MSASGAGKFYVYIERRPLSAYFFFLTGFVIPMIILILSMRGRRAA